MKAKSQYIYSAYGNLEPVSNLLYKGISQGFPMNVERDHSRRTKREFVVEMTTVHGNPIKSKHHEKKKNIYHDLGLAGNNRCTYAAAFEFLSISLWSDSEKKKLIPCFVIFRAPNSQSAHWRPPSPPPLLPRFNCFEELEAMSTQLLGHFDSPSRGGHCTNNAQWVITS